MRYIFLGDRYTHPDLIGLQCDPVRRADGKCIVSPAKKDGVANALVIDAKGNRYVVPRRRLRLNKEYR